MFRTKDFNPDARPFAADRLQTLQTYPRLTQVARRGAQHGAVAVFLHDIGAARRIVVADGSAMSLILQAYVDDAV